MPKLSFPKSVEVSATVEITLDEVLQHIGEKDLRQACEDRGIELKAPKTKSDPEPGHEIEQQDIDDMLNAFRRNDWREFLWALEWALPREFRGLSDLMGGKLRQA